MSEYEVKGRTFLEAQELVKVFLKKAGYVFLKALPGYEEGERADKNYIQILTTHNLLYHTVRIIPQGVMWDNDIQVAFVDQNTVTCPIRIYIHHQNQMDPIRDGTTLDNLVNMVEKQIRSITSEETRKLSPLC